MDVSVPYSDCLAGNVPFQQLIAASPVCVDGGAILSWKLIWCHYDWSLKDLRKEGRVQRNMFVNHVLTPHNGVMQSLRGGVVTVMAWLQSDAACPSVLLTDWRNAKPIIEQLEDNPDCTRPRLIIVLCTLRRQLTKAWKWLQTLPPSVGPLCVCWGVSIPWNLLGGVLQSSIGALFCNVNPNGHLVQPLQSMLGACAEEEPRLEDGEKDDDSYLPSITERTEMPMFPSHLPVPATLVPEAGGVLSPHASLVPRPARLLTTMA